MLFKRETFTSNLQKDEEKAVMEILKIGTSAGGANITPKGAIVFIFTVQNSEEFQDFH